MGLFDMFTKEGRLRKHARQMSDRNALPEDREATERWLLDEGSGQALYALLKRFDVRLSQTIVDKQEKERLFNRLVGLGSDLDKPLAQFLRESQHRTWPLKLLEAREGTDAAVQVVFELLEREKGGASFEPERKKHLLVWLADHQHPEVIAQCESFLDDFDEEVRYAAAEAILAQDDEAGRASLARVLAKPDEESMRLKHRLLTVFAKRGWRVDEPQAVAAAMPDGFRVDDEGRVAAS